MKRRWQLAAFSIKVIRFLTPKDCPKPKKCKNFSRIFTSIRCLSLFNNCSFVIFTSLTRIWGPMPVHFLNSSIIIFSLTSSFFGWIFCNATIFPFMFFDVSIDSKSGSLILYLLVRVSLWINLFDSWKFPSFLSVFFYDEKNSIVDTSNSTFFYFFFEILWITSIVLLISETLLVLSFNLVPKNPLRHSLFIFE